MEATKAVSASALIKTELENLFTEFEEETQRIRQNAMDDAQISKRLLYLFQHDLLPGLHGLILEAKDKRDHKSVKAVSQLNMQHGCF
jgi:hypothetical protein